MANWMPIKDSPQEDFLSSLETEVLFGGAAGGAKTESLIVDPLKYVGFPDFKAVLFRRTFPNMMEIQDRCRQLYPMLGGEYRAGEHRWSFPSGATIQLGHMADTDSHFNYLSFEYSYIGFDEAGQFLPNQLAYLFSRLRSKNPNIPRKMRYCTNPGGPAHQYLKDRFRIAQYPAGQHVFTDEVTVKNPYTRETVIQRVTRKFIPALVWDNPHIMDHDPTYIANLYQLPEIERMRLLEGRWDAFQGQMFSELNQELHGFSGDLPQDWETYAAFDWGYARPWCYQIWRVDYDGRLWLDYMHYGTREGFVNVGVRQTDTEIARKIREIESDLKVTPRWRVAGADIWNPKRRRDGMIGPAPVENLQAEGVTFIRADTNRIQGWQQIHHRLMPDEDGEPMLKVRNSLEHWWRTMLALQEDERNPEDISTKDIEDHPPETTRYMCMTRPMKPRMTQRDDSGTFQAERRKMIQAKQKASRYGISLHDAYRKVR